MAEYPAPVGGTNPDHHVIGHRGGHPIKRGVPVPFHGYDTGGSGAALDHRSHIGRITSGDLDKLRTGKIPGLSEDWLGQAECCRKE